MGLIRGREQSRLFYALFVLPWGVEVGRLQTVDTPCSAPIRPTSSYLFLFKDVERKRESTWYDG